MAEISGINQDDSRRIVPGDIRKFSIDQKTGETIYRQRFFVFEDLPDGGLPEDINTAITMVESAKTAALAARQFWVAAALMLMQSDLYSSRANPATGRKDSSDRTKAKQILGLLMALNLKKGEGEKRLALFKEYGIFEEDETKDAKLTFSPDLVDQPEVYIAQAKLAVADLVIKQMDDNETPPISMTEVLKYCTEARDVLSKMIPTKRDYGALGRSWVLEAKLRILRNDKNLDRDEKIIELLEQGKAAVGTLPDPEASKKLKAQIRQNMKGNLYIGGTRGLYSSLDSDGRVQKAMDDNDYIAASADVEEAKLLTSKVKVAEGKERTDFIEKLRAGIQKCRDAKALCVKIGKPYAYMNSDAALTEADLIAKLGRLYTSTSELTTDRATNLNLAMGLYADILKSPYYKFNDVKARAVVGKYSIQIELGEFDWDAVNKVLEDYFDPSAGINNVKYPFNDDTYPYMSALHLESQLRNIAKRTQISIPGCDTCEITPKMAGKISDYDLATLRAKYASDNVKNIKYLRDPDAVYDILARVTLDEAQGTASKSMKMQDGKSKIGFFAKAVGILRKLFLSKTQPNPVLGGESTAVIEADPTNKKMEVSFYVAAWAEEAGNLAQMVWQTNSNERHKRTELFDPVIAKYDAAIAMCDRSLASYDKVDRKVNMQLAKRKIELLRSLPLEFKLDNRADVENTLQAVDTYIGEIDKSIDEAETRTYPNGFSDRNIAKFKAGLKRLKCEAICLKIYFINKQSAESGAVYNGNTRVRSRDEEITRLYGEAKKVADKILPDLDVKYYTVLDMLGISSVYLRLDPNTAVDNIMHYYNEYIKREKFDITYDMVDALANAAAKNKDKDLYTDVKGKLKELIDNSATTPVSRAKAFVWQARLDTWFYDEDDPAYCGTAFLKNIADEYQKALDIYKDVTGEDAQTLYENGVSMLMVKAEKAEIDFRWANSAYKENTDSDVKARVSEYRKIADVINKDIGGKSTIREGLALIKETEQKVEDQDKAAEIKARLTFTSIVLALSEPISLKSISEETRSISAEAAKAICGIAVKDENDLRTQGETMFNGIIDDMGKLSHIDETGKSKLTDVEMSNMGIDVLDVYTSMAENYMILALKAIDTNVREAYFDKFKAIVDTGITKAQQMQTNLDNELRGKVTEGKLTVLLGNMNFWKTQRIAEAVPLYEKGFNLITGEDMPALEKDIFLIKKESLKDDMFKKVILKDLATYADAVAITVMKMKTRADNTTNQDTKIFTQDQKNKAEEVADKLLDIVVSRDTHQSIYGAKAHMRKGDLVLSNTVDLSEDPNVLAKIIKRLNGALAQLETALSQANPVTLDTNDLKNYKDPHMGFISAELKSFANAPKLNKDLMGILCRLMEANIRSYNKKSREERKDVWGQEFDLINIARRLVQKYILQEFNDAEYNNICSEAQDITKLGSTIDAKLTKIDKTKDIGETLRRIPTWRAVLIESGVELQMQDAVDVSRGPDYKPDVDLPANHR